MMSYFARFNYTFADKYLIELTGRYDGSSRFTAKNRWGFFPTVSIGRRISEQHFFDPLKEAIENAIMVLMAMGGSTNGIMHLQAIHKEAGLGHLPLEAFDRFSKRIPQIASVYPSSPYDMVDFY